MLNWTSIANLRTLNCIQCILNYLWLKNVHTFLVSCTCLTKAKCVCVMHLTITWNLNISPQLVVRDLLWRPKWPCPFLCDCTAPCIKAIYCKLLMFPHLFVSKSINRRMHYVIYIAIYEVYQHLLKLLMGNLTHECICNGLQLPLVSWESK